MRFNEKKYLVGLINKSQKNISENLKLSADGKIQDQWDDEVEIYKGNFSNQGFMEYAFVTTGGSMHSNTVTIYKLLKGQLVNAGLDQIIINNLFPGQDMSRFYMHVANTFAVTKNGKTYLRFMNYPGGNQDYDKTKLLLCSYLWQEKKFTLAEPNWTYTKSSDKLVPAKNCIGSSPS